MTKDPVNRDFIPAAYSEKFARFFGWWVREKMMGKKFYAVRVTADTAGALRDARDHEGPVICACNHVSWWDPLVMFTLHRTELCKNASDVRTLRAPMDAAQLQRFSFFKKLGVFGIDPDDAASLEAMSDYLATYFDEAPAPTLWINPQGRFADVREKVTPRPGTARVAASDERSACVAVALEYQFWLDQKPEILVRVEPVTPAKRSTTGWQRALTNAMNDNAASLAELAIARDPAVFECVIGGDAPSINPAYDLWLRLRGRAGSINDRSRPSSGSLPGPTPTGADVS